MNGSSALSVKDLLEARDLYHLHLMNKRNVVATAIGLHRFRLQDLDTNNHPLAAPPEPHAPRTLGKSKVVAESWPCVLVFVQQWQTEAELIHDPDRTNLLPRRLFMPDGRIVPVCIVEARQESCAPAGVSLNLRKFPANLVSGGCPLVTLVQGEERIGSVGCLVTNGDQVFVLTNSHIAGEAGRRIFAPMGGHLTPVGQSTSRQYGKVKLSKAYPTFPGDRVLLNLDAGLVQIDDINQWKTEILHLGEPSVPDDFNDTNISLALIGQPVECHGAVSGHLKGEIAALFYRYKATGGFEYVSDYLIGPPQDGTLATHHGDSGTLWLRLENGELKPFALQWGQHTFEDQTRRQPYVLATGLGNLCRLLEVEVVRNRNTAQEYTWGKIGHFAIASIAIDAINQAKYPRLSALMRANLDRISFQTPIISAALEAVTGTSSFVPLSDVPDLVWKGTKAGITRKPHENPCHYADIDLGTDGDTLQKLCAADPTNLAQDTWLQFYKDAGRTQERDFGCLPFRVGQIYNAMVDAVTRRNSDRFIVAAGVLAHYVGDSAMPLHSSQYSQGDGTAATKDVHDHYEKEMLDGHITEIMESLPAAMATAEDPPLAIDSATAATRAAFGLMDCALTTLPPATILDIHRQASLDTSTDIGDALWDGCGTQTLPILATACRYLARLWEAAWEQGHGEDRDIPPLKQSKDALARIYNCKRFIQSRELGQIPLAGTPPCASGYPDCATCPDPPP